MELTLAGVLIDLLQERLPKAKIGIVVRGVRKIDPVQIAAAIPTPDNGSLAVAVVGYETTVPGPDAGLEIATNIEAAVSWRNQTTVYAGRILVFVAGAVEKLASL